MEPDQVVEFEVKGAAGRSSSTCGRSRTEEEVIASHEVCRDAYHRDKPRGSPRRRQPFCGVGWGTTPSAGACPTKVNSPSIWWMRSSISLPGLNVTTLFGPTSTRSPVRRIVRLAGLAPLDLKDAEIAQLDAAFAEQRIHRWRSKVFWTTSLVLSCVKPVSSEICLTISFFVTDRSLLTGGTR